MPNYFQGKGVFNKKNTIGDQVFMSFNQLQIYQACLLCRGDEWSSRACRALRFFLRARAEIKNLLCELASNAKI